MKNSFFAEVGNVFTYALASLQSNEIFQTIEFIVAILTSVVLLAFRIWKWWKEAKKDGKITKDEIGELTGIIAEGVDDIKDKAKDKNKED